jgi:hypothetical protein
LIREASFLPKDRRRHPAPPAISRSFPISWERATFSRCRPRNRLGATGTLSTMRRQSRPLRIGLPCEPKRSSIDRICTSPPQTSAPATPFARSSCPFTARPYSLRSLGHPKHHSKHFSSECSAIAPHWRSPSDQKSTADWLVVLLALRPTQLVGDASRAEPALGV